MRVSTRNRKILITKKMYFYIFLRNQDFFLKNQLILMFKNDFGGNENENNLC
jgi:hypothetical protein